MYTNFNPPPCCKCGLALIVKQRQIIGIKPGDGFNSSVMLERVTWECPTLEGVLGIFRRSHDMRDFNQDGTEEYFEPFINNSPHKKYDGI